jgi:hypothetical protein
MQVTKPPGMSRAVVVRGLKPHPLMILAPNAVTEPLQIYPTLVSIVRPRCIAQRSHSRI